MKKVILAFFIISLILISGCKESLTGKSVAEPAKEVENSDERIIECVRACNDGTKPEEYFVNSCSKILQFGGEQVFRDYIENCR